MDTEEMQKKIVDLEGVSSTQANQIEELKKTLETCLNRIDSLESSLKSSKTPNHLDLNTKKGPQLRPKASATTPRTPVKALRNSGTTRRSTPDLVNHRELSFNKGEGSIRIFIRGRPINLYVPPNLKESIDVKTSQPMPDENLKMEWVYGYRGRDCRKNVYYQSTSGDLVYFVAGVVVLHNLKSGEQRHYVEHTDDIKCLAMHPDKVTFASGQVASHSKQEGKPHVRVWSSITLQTLHIIGQGHFDRAVAALAFSKSDNGLFLATVDEANDHNLTVWDWAKKKSISTSKSSTEAVIEVEFDPKDASLLYTCGKSHLVYWQLKSGALTKKTAIYEKYEKPKFVTSMTFSPKGELITGDSSGHIYFWNEKRTVGQQIQAAHDGPIFSIIVTGSSLITTGGKDYRVVEWDVESLEKKGEVKFDAEYGCGRSICEMENGQMIIGTTQNCLIQMSISGGVEHVVLHGHHDELWALSTHPASSLFLSGSFDKRLMVWDATTHSVVASLNVDYKIQSVALDRVSGSLCVIGGLEGEWGLFKVNSGSIELLDSGKEGVEPIQCCEFSPDGAHVALGSRDNSIYVFSVKDESKLDKHGKCAGHSSFITHLDWSKDGQMLRSNSGDYELLIWQVETCKQQTAVADAAGVEWATCNCTIAFEAAGIWPEGSDGTDINAVTKAHSETLMATADDFGKVNLYRYPAYAAKSNHRVKPGHSSHVTNVQFLHDDKKLLSTGGQDTAIIQWSLI